MLAWLDFRVHSGRSTTLILQAGVIQAYHQADFGQIRFSQE